MHVQETENIWPHKNLYTRLLVTAFFITAKKQKQPRCPSVGEWTNNAEKHIQWNSNWRQKEWGADTCYNVDGTWRHDAKWQRPVKKDPINCMIPFIRNVQNRRVNRGRKQRSGWSGQEKVSGLGEMAKGHRNSFLGVINMFSNWWWWWPYNFVSTKNHWLVHFK